MDSSSSQNDLNITISRNITPAQVITAIIVGSVILALIVLNILVFISYKKAVKSYNDIMKKNRSIMDIFQNKLGHNSHRHSNDLDDSASLTTVSRPNSRCSEADTLPRKQSLDSDIIEYHTVQQKHKPILKHHPHLPYEERGSNQRLNKIGTPIPFGFRQPEKKKYFKHETKTAVPLATGHKSSPMLIKANTKKNGQRWPTDSYRHYQGQPHRHGQGHPHRHGHSQPRSLSVENLHNLHRDAETVHHGPMKRVSLVSSESQLEDMAQFNRLRRESRDSVSPIVTDFKHIDVKSPNGMSSNRSKENQPIKLSVRPGANRMEVTDFSRSHPNLNTIHSDNDFGRRGSHDSLTCSSSNIIVTDLHHIDIKGDNLNQASELRHIDSDSSGINFSCASTSITAKRSHIDTKGHNSHQFKGGIHDISHGQTPAIISDFRHIDQPEETRGVNTNSGNPPGPVSVQVKDWRTKAEIEEEKQNGNQTAGKGINSGSLASISCSSMTYIHDAVPKGGKSNLEPNTSTDTIDSFEAAILACKGDNYGDIEIVDNSSVSRLRRSRNETEKDYPVIEFQNLGFDKTAEPKTELGTFYISDVEL